MATKPHIYFLPMMAPGHMIPLINIARQFSRLGAKSTIITTPLNASQFSQTIQNDQNQGLEISISLIQFPCQEAGLPPACENLSSTTTSEMSLSFYQALDLLEEPVESLLRQSHPDCIVTGAFFRWATDVALKFNVPRLIFLGCGFFPMCITRSLKEHMPHEEVELDSEEFIIPGLPDEIRMSRRQIPDLVKKEDNNPLAKTIRKILESNSRCYGIIVNSFYELEPAYATHFREVSQRKAWHIGPVSLYNNNTDQKRGKEESNLKWLDSKNPNSVIYICFGSMSMMSQVQIVEIAKGLKASGVQFVWVVRENGAALLPDGFEKRVEGSGLIIRGWAPQVQILEHEAIGGFVTHCGWNSVLEGVAAGVPMVTWPLSAEQFFNEKLVVEILKTGTPVGAAAWSERGEEKEAVNWEKLEKAVVRLMVEEEGEGMKIRARELGILARRAVEMGGSSHKDFVSLLEEIKLYNNST